MSLLTSKDISNFITSRETDTSGRFISIKPSQNPDLEVAYAWGKTVSEDVHQIIIFSNNPRYPERKGIHAGPEEVLDQIEKATGKACKSILGYSIDGGIEKDYIKGYKHRGLFVEKDLKGEGIGGFLHESMNQIAGVETKEITYVPSLLYFYMLRGFEIDKIHIIVDGETVSPCYSLTPEQKEQIISIIDWCLQNGDLSLPFFVELKNTGKSFKKENFHDGNVPPWLPEIIHYFQASNEEGYRSFFFQDPIMMDTLEKWMDLKPHT